MTVPSISGVLQVTAPVFVRKLGRRGHWGESTDQDQVARLRDAVEKVFHTPREPAISVYLVSTDEDLRRVALGMNAARGSLREAVPFVAFLPAEVQAAGIAMSQTLGDLPCAHANRLHYDWVATESQLLALCDAVMKASRVAGNCSQGMMKDALTEAQKEKCQTAGPEAPCQVAGCHTV